jgi:hypothetical protein
MDGRSGKKAAGQQLAARPAGSTLIAVVRHEPCSASELAPLGNSADHGALLVCVLVERKATGMPSADICSRNRQKTARNSEDVRCYFARDPAAPQDFYGGQGAAS